MLTHTKLVLNLKQYLSLCTCVYAIVQSWNQIDIIVGFTWSLVKSTMSLN
jgi:hypothetical protein